MPKLITYYQSLTRREKGVINQKIHAQVGIPYVSFNRKMKLDSFTQAEQIVISQILNAEISELFPSEPALQNNLTTI